MTKNIEVMNDLADKDYGSIAPDGEFKLYSNPTYFEQESFVLDWNWNFWSGWHFTTGDSGTETFGGLGIVVNGLPYAGDILKAVKKWKSDTDEFEEALGVVFLDYSNEMSSLLSYKPDWFDYVVSFGLDSLTVAYDFLTYTTGLKWFVDLILDLAGIYLPGLINSLYMIVLGFTEHAHTEVNIGWWWSSYDILE